MKGQPHRATVVEAIYSTNRDDAILDTSMEPSFATSVRAIRSVFHIIQHVLHDY